MGQTVTPQGRKRTTIEDRARPCQFCGYPLSQRHHSAPFANYGENPLTLHLCANCHELYHLVLTAQRSPKKQAAALLRHWVSTFGELDERYQLALHHIEAAEAVMRGE